MGLRNIQSLSIILDMKLHQGFLYLLAVIGIYILVFIMGYVLLGSLIAIFISSDMFKIIFFIFYLLLIDPLITYRISEHLPFKIYGLKVEDGLEADLKKDVEI